MDILKNETVKNAAAGLWHKFLLAETVNDIILLEIKNRLYLQDVDEDWIMSPETSLRDTFMARVTELAFGDIVEEAVTSLYEHKDSLRPYSDLAEATNPGRLYDLMMETVMGQLTCHDGNAVKRNPYYEQIHISPDKENRIALATADYLPYEFFQTFHNYKEENPFLYGEAGFFKERMTFPVILEDNRVWMSVIPSEIRSMEKDIEAAKGKVITYGLGLGYYAFMASEKETVESVSVVEMNRDVISLFKRNILPQFPNKEKIRIIEADAFAFIEKQKDGSYDTAFSDFWSGVDDGLDLYLRFMAKTARFVKTKHSYWIETCFMEYFFRPVLIRILMEQITGKKIIMPEASGRARKVQSHFETYLKARPDIITSQEELTRLFTNESMISLMRDFAVKNPMQP
jgi:hypothetical protein